jgi:hydrogenase nickel incorporation protein HypA/HybF
MRHSLAEDACLEIEEVPGQAWCMQCAATVEVHQRYDECPGCGSYQLQVTGGEQMRIKDLEVE